VVARAQQTALPVIGFIGSDTPDLYLERLRAFRLGLRVAGFIESRNVAIEYMWAEGQNGRLPALATELVRRQVAVIVATTTPSTLAAKAVTKTIPIIFFVAGDPVELALVASLNRPGANLTGATTLTLEAGQKRLELLRAMVPNAASICLLVNPTSPNLAEAQSRDLQKAASGLGLQLHVVRASTEADFDAAFASATQLHADGLVVSSDSFFFAKSERLAALAALHKVPTIYGFRESALAGGLLSYGGNIAEAHRWVGVYAGRVLKGDSPAEMPVQQSTKFDLVINLGTAQILGLDVPPTLLARADEVIE
jgi:putative ABC transport system substrate-binding protein